MLDGKFVTLDGLKKNKSTLKKYNAYIAKIKNDDFKCENFIPILKFDFVVSPCPVDMKDCENTDEIDRAKNKIDYVVNKCLIAPYDFRLTELELANSKTLLFAKVFSYILEYILQMNQDIDIILSDEICDYLFEMIYDKVLIKYLGVNHYSDSKKKIAYAKNIFFRVMSNDNFKFITINSWNSVQNINSCFVDMDTLNIEFEMPKTVI